MSKKVLSIIAIAVVVMLSITLVACNAYKWDSIGAGDPTANPISNGGYFVKQGNFAYFMNGYAGESTDGNEFGAAVKGAIVRANIVNGKIDNSTTKVVVPKNVYTTTSGTGFAIYGEWIYYVSYNYNKDKNGARSTTDLDIMRTKIDGSLTQCIQTIGSRDIKYIFTPTRFLYYSENAIKFVDFSGMSTTKETKNGKGAVAGTLAENVSSVVWGYQNEYKGAGIADYIFYTQSLTGDDSYKNYNKLFAVKYDGSDSRCLATETTYLAQGVDPANDPQHVFKFSLLNIYFDSDSQATIYYTKSFYKSSADETVGLFCNKFTAQEGFVVANEKKLNSVANSTVFPLGYEEGCLAYNASNVYCYYNGENVLNPIQINEASSCKVWFVKDGYAFFTGSDGEELFKIKYKQADNIASVAVECMKIDWLPLEVDGNMLYFYTNDDNDYLYALDFVNYDADNKDTEASMIGIYLDADKPAQE